jgi:hypothetical protein
VIAHLVEDEDEGQRLRKRNGRGRQAQNGQQPLGGLRSAHGFHEGRRHFLKGYLSAAQRFEEQAAAFVDRRIVEDFHKRPAAHPGLFDQPHPSATKAWRSWRYCASSIRRRTACTRGFWREVIR